MRSARFLLVLAGAGATSPLLGQSVVALSGGVSAANGVLALLQPVVLARLERDATPDEGGEAVAPVMSQPPMERFLGRCVGAALLGWAGSALCAVAVGTELLFCRLNALPMALLTHTFGRKAGPLSLQFHAQACLTALYVLVGASPVMPTRGPASSGRRVTPASRPKTRLSLPSNTRIYMA